MIVSSVATVRQARYGSILRADTGHDNRLLVADCALSAEIDRALQQARVVAASAFQPHALDTPRYAARMLMALSSASLASSSSIQMQQRSMPLMNSCDPTNGLNEALRRTSLIASCSLLRQRSSNRCPPSVGMFPKLISARSLRSGRDELSTITFASWNQVGVDVVDVSTMTVAVIRIENKLSCFAGVV